MTPQGVIGAVLIGIDTLCCRSNSFTLNGPQKKIFEFLYFSLGDIRILESIPCLGSNSFFTFLIKQ